MSRNRTLALLTLSAVVLSGGACAKPEHKVEKRKKGVHVRAPYTSVDVEIPVDDEDDVDVDVRVRP